ncbi:hypothetical protein RJ641_024201 [Dillenia turbinata]|uniref:Uncharacterized protein n=1 Tax=Dillenia turbinata TaxID=194707 RepID=A0AAN8YWD0_9MAGN
MIGALALHYSAQNSLDILGTHLHSRTHSVLLVGYMSKCAFKTPKPIEDISICNVYKRWGVVRLNCPATNLRSSARSANASTSVSDLTVRVDEGRFRLELGINAHVNNSSPQKSPGPRVMELKKPDRPPLVVELSSWPLMMNSISVTGSPSRTM